MFTRACIATCTLLALSAVTEAAPLHVNNMQFDFTGTVGGRAVAYCGPFALAQTLPSAANTFTIAFGDSDILGGALQITNDNLLPPDTTTNLNIIKRLKTSNTLNLIYADTATALESGERLKALIVEKAAQHGVDFGSAVTVKAYSNRIVLGKKVITMTEKVTIVVPHYPRSVCSTTISGRRVMTAPTIKPQ